MKRSPLSSACVLLSQYSFDLENYDVEQIVQHWLDEYPAKWVVAAVVESIYQGRYKIASVDNILVNWYLNGRPQHHFDVEFADLVCGSLFNKLSSQITNSNESSRAEDIVLNTISEKSKLSDSIDYSKCSNNDKLNLKNFNQGKIANKDIDRWLKLVTKL